MWETKHGWLFSFLTTIELKIQLMKSLKVLNRVLKKQFRLFFEDLFLFIFLPCGLSK
jgi:hypothetical protein